MMFLGIIERLSSGEGEMGPGGPCTPRELIKPTHLFFFYMRYSYSLYEPSHFPPTYVF